jgi:acyl-CoA thioester hydrolase
MFSHRLDVRFRDCDPMGHCNNAVYLTYLEQTRFAHWRWLRDLSAGEHDGVAPDHGMPHLPSGMPGVILARIECDYKRPARYGESLDVRLRVSAVGRSSFTYEYEIVDVDGKTVLVARSVQVLYDYAAGTPVQIPPPIRALLLRTPEAAR